jgi:hypothetical protein
VKDIIEEKQFGKYSLSALSIVALRKNMNRGLMLWSLPARGAEDQRAIVSMMVDGLMRMKPETRA